MNFLENYNQLGVLPGEEKFRLTDFSNIFTTRQMDMPCPVVYDKLYNLRPGQCRLPVYDKGGICIIGYETKPCPKLELKPIETEKLVIKTADKTEPAVIVKEKQIKPEHLMIGGLLALLLLRK